MPRAKRKPSDGPKQPDAGTKRYDNALKWIAQHEPVGLTKLIDTSLTLVSSSVSTDLPVMARQVDVVFLVELPNGERGLLHIEFQLAKDKDISERVAEYALRLHLRHQLPVHSVVIYLRKESDLPKPPFGWKWKGREELRHDYEVIYLWELPQETVLQAPYPILWPLAGMMARVTQDSVAAVGEQIAGTALERQEKSELIGLLGVLAGVQLSLTEITEAIRRNPMIDELWKASSFSQMVHDVFVEEGEMKAARELAQAALEGRFGTLSDDLIAALGKADKATLEAVVRNSSRDSMEQARERLGLV